MLPTCIPILQISSSYLGILVHAIGKTVQVSTITITKTIAKIENRDDKEVRELVAGHKRVD